MQSDASSIIHPATSLAVPVPLPQIGITTRIASLDDLPFIDSLQKQYHKELGFFPRAQMEGYLKNEWVIVAESGGERIGYCASRDRYLKRDELGAIFQLCVVPGRQRGLIGANLLKSVFERASYGTKLFCCWCAQDLQANYFWESMGFVPLAFRAGSREKSRVHIFWERRIRSGDTTTPWWFPSQTAGGSIREDRLVLPIPPGTHWKEVMPVILPREGANILEDKTSKPVRKSALTPADAKPKTSLGRLSLAMPEVKKNAPKPKQPRKKIKHDPKHIAAARELRDRWLEKVNENPSLALAGKYDVSRLPSPTREMNMLAA